MDYEWEWPLILIIIVIIILYVLYVIYLMRKDDMELKKLQATKKDLGKFREIFKIHSFFSLS